MMTKTHGRTRWLAWRNVPRSAKHRTSMLTNDAIRDCLYDLTRGKAGAGPNADAVILAAMRRCPPDALREELALIYGRTYSVDEDDTVVEYETGS